MRQKWGSELESFVGVTLGWLGTVGTFSAYVMIWGGWVDSTAKRYSLLNAAGGSMAAAGAFAYGAWPAFASNAVWGLIGVLGLVTALRKKAAARSEARQKAQRSAALPVMPLDWNPSKTEAAPIVLPWLVRSVEENVVQVDFEAKTMPLPLMHATTGDVSGPSLSMPSVPPTQPMQLAC